MRPPSLKSPCLSSSTVLERFQSPTRRFLCAASRETPNSPLEQVRNRRHTRTNSHPFIDRKRRVASTVERDFNRSRSRGTKRPVESPNTIHVLSILGLLLLPDPVDLVPWNFGIMSRFKRRKPHQPPQSCVVLVLVFVNRHCIVFG